MAGMSSFYVTFGVMYRYEPHPIWQLAHPDALLRVHAPDLNLATKAVQLELGEHYAFIYPESKMKFNLHPRGVVGSIIYTGIVDIS